MSKDLSLNLEFTGGAEFLLDNVKDHKVIIPAVEDNFTVKNLFCWIRKEMLKDCYRPELLIDGDSVTPGILIIINDCDWELTGGEDTILKNNDTISFISTLHGG